MPLYEVAVDAKHFLSSEHTYFNQIRNTYEVRDLGHLPVETHDGQGVAHYKCPLCNGIFSLSRMERGQWSQLRRNRVMLHIIAGTIIVGSTYWFAQGFTREIAPWIPWVTYGLRAWGLWLLLDSIWQGLFRPLTLVVEEYGTDCSHHAKLVRGKNQ